MENGFASDDGNDEHSAASDDRREGACAARLPGCSGSYDGDDCERNVDRRKRTDLSNGDEHKVDPLEPNRDDESEDEDVPMRVVDLIKFFSRNASSPQR
jgi:hypothetical protein